MRVRDDPRAAAELFCSQNGVTDEETIDLLEDTLRRLYFPSSSYPLAPSSTQSPFLPEASNTKPWPPTSEIATDTVEFIGHTHATRRDEASTSAAAGGAGKNSAYEARGLVRALSDPAAVEVIPDAVGTIQRATNRPQQDQHHEKQRRQQYEDIHSDHERISNKGSNEPAAEKEEAAAPAATPAAESPAEINVIDVAARMRDVAKASHDPADPNSVLVDLVVNGQPAPLAFRVTREPARISLDRSHSKNKVENDDKWHEDGQGGGAADDADESRGQEQRNEGDAVEKAGDEGGQTKEELHEEAVAAAAREWCAAFGTDRAEDIFFVEAEIRKAVVAAKAATAAAAATGDAGSDRFTSLEAAQNRPRGNLERPETAGVSRTGGKSDGRETRHDEHATGGGRGKKERRRAKRLSIASVLAPDVEKGTSMFWVKVDPSLPELYVIAGSSALELSEVFCRDHNLGPSQVPLVAWKVLEAYPLQMEAARRDETLAPARITLGYAACQREVQVAFVLLVATMLWITRWRLSGWLARGNPGAAGPHQRRRNRGTISTKLWASGSPVFPSWARWQHNKHSSRGQKIATLSRERREKKSVSDTRDHHSKAEGGTALTKSGSISWTTNEPTNTNGDTNTTESTKTTNGGDAVTGGGDNDSEGGRPSRSPHKPLSSRLSSWADAVLFEAGRVVGASVRVVVRPLALIHRGTSEASASSKGGETEGDSPAATSTKTGVQPRNLKGSRTKATKGSGNSAKASRGASRGPKPVTAVAKTPKKPSSEVSDSATGRKKVPFAAGDVQRAMEGADAGTKNGSQEEEAAAGEAAATETAGGSDRRKHGTWTSVLDSLAKDPNNRFLETAFLSNAGHILAKSDAFAVETHEACDWMRLFKNKKGDIIVGGQKFVVLSREEGSIIISSKTLGSKMIGSKTRSGSAIVGVYADLSKSEARESVEWLVDALASAPVR